jgi:hypothetical protein
MGRLTLRRKYSSMGNVESVETIMPIMNDQQITTQANGMFLAFEGHRLREMAEAMLDSGFFKGAGLDAAKALFRERGLGANNVLNFLRYAESLTPEELTKAIYPDSHA